MLTWIRTRLARLLFRLGRRVMPWVGGFERVKLRARAMSYGDGTPGVIVLIEKECETLAFQATPEDVLRMAKDLRSKARIAAEFAREGGR